MRCSPKACLPAGRLCIGFLLLGFGGILIWTPEGLSKFTPFLFVLACPLMCVVSMMFGKSCHDEHPRATKRRKIPRHSPSHHVED